MRTSPVLVGALCGVALALGGVLVADLASEPADAQGGGGFVTQAEFERELRATNRRSIAARRSAVNNFNLIGRFLAPENEIIGVEQPPGVITQLRGTGDGGVPSGAIAERAITRDKIADEAVDSAKIAPGGITSGDLAPSSVNGAKITPGAVSTEELADQAVSDGKLEDGAVSTAKLAGQAVSSGKIADEAVGEPKIASQAVGEPKLADQSVSPRTIGVPIAARVNGSAVVPSSTISTTPVSFTGPGPTGFDTAGLYSAEDPVLLTVPLAGIYRLSARVPFTAATNPSLDTAGERGFSFRQVRNGAQFSNLSQAILAPNGTTNGTVMSGSRLVKAETGDQFGVSAFQSNGNDQSLATNNAVFEIEYVGPLP